MENHFDTIIIGSGPGGLATAYELNKHGQNVAVVENDLWGGTCPNRGCDPKKMLYQATLVADQARQFEGHGLSANPQIDWPDLMAHKKEYTDGVPSGTRDGLISAGITPLKGTAEFIDPHMIFVDYDLYSADHFVIATGCKANHIKDLDSEYIGTSTDFLAMPTLPPNILFIGGGDISFELANIAAKSGSHVHIVHHNSRPLKDFPESLVVRLMAHMDHSRVEIHLDESVTSIVKTEGQLQVTLASGKILMVDQVIEATGRIPNVESLNLGAAHVKVSKHGIKVDARLRTTNPNIHAVGDCVDKFKPKLTPVASFEGFNVAHDILTPWDDDIHELSFRQRVAYQFSYPVIPRILFTSPQIAFVGEVFLKPKEIKYYNVTNFDLTNWLSFRYRAEPAAEAIIITRKYDNKIVGASFFTQQAEELANWFTLIINGGLTKFQMENLIFLYPSLPSDLKYFRP